MLLSNISTKQGGVFVRWSLINSHTFLSHKSCARFDPVGPAFQTNQSFQLSVLWRFQYAFLMPSKLAISFLDSRQESADVDQPWKSHQCWLVAEPRGDRCDIGDRCYIRSRKAMAFHLAGNTTLLLMDTFLHQLRCMKPGQEWVNQLISILR